MKNALSVLSFCLAIYSVVPYIADIIRGKTKPNVVTWFTWTLLTAIATAAALADGQARSAVITFATALATGSVVVLGLKYGVAKMSLFDGLCQLGAILGILFWLIFNSPIIAIYASLAIDFIALLPTLKHSFVEPGEETWESYAIAAFAASLTLVSVLITKHNVSGILFPAYLTFADGSLAVVIILRRKNLHETKNSLKSQRV